MVSSRARKLLVVDEIFKENPKFPMPYETLSPDGRSYILTADGVNTWQGSWTPPHLIRIASFPTVREAVFTTEEEMVQTGVDDIARQEDRYLLRLLAATADREKNIANKVPFGYKLVKFEDEFETVKLAVIDSPGKLGVFISYLDVAHEKNHMAAKGNVGLVVDELVGMIVLNPAGVFLIEDDDANSN